MKVDLFSVAFMVAGAFYLGMAWQGWKAARRFDRTNQRKV